MFFFRLKGQYRFLQIYFFLRNFIYFIFKRLGWVQVCCYVCDLCLHLLFLSTNLRDTFVISREKKVRKFAYFVETMMYECSIFLINMMVFISLIVNSVLFCLRSYARETSLHLRKNWIDNYIRFSFSILCTINN